MDYSENRVIIDFSSVVLVFVYALKIVQLNSTTKKINLRQQWQSVKWIFFLNQALLVRSNLISSCGFVQNPNRTHAMNIRELRGVCVYVRVRQNQMAVENFLYLRFDSYSLLFEVFTMLFFSFSFSSSLWSISIEWEAIKHSHNITKISCESNFDPHTKTQLLILQPHLLFCIFVLLCKQPNSKNDLIQWVPCQKGWHARSKIFNKFVVYKNLVYIFHQIYNLIKWENEEKYDIFL